MAELRFRAWAQSAIGREHGPDTLGDLPARRFDTHITVTEGATGRAADGRGSLKMLGPGGAIGIDPAAVVRTDPAHGTAEVESNYLACIEFSIPELPWLLTPARQERERLRPWIVLVVVEADTPFDAALAPARLHVDTAQLPDLSDSWAWAHVQEPLPGAQLPPGIELGMQRSVSRLLCPRRLSENTSYRACVVPAFAGGRAAGLGETGTETESNARAWDVAAPRQLELPVYYTWEFRTGPAGDFEMLARRVEHLPDELARAGALMVDIRRPWERDKPLLGDQTEQLVPVQGALQPLSSPPAGTATDAARRELKRRLTAQLDRTETDCVGPPLYGGAHVNRRTVADAQDWLGELNLEAPNRIAAGLGAEYVRAHQEELMARAWEQAGAIREANRELAIGRLNTEVAARMHERHIGSLSPGELLAVAAPAATRTRAAQEPTLSMQVAVSPLPDAVVSTAYARFMRPNGPAGKAPGALDEIAAAGLSEGLRDAGPLLAPVEEPPLPEPESPVAEAIRAAMRATDADALAGQVVVLEGVRTVAEARGLGRHVTAVGAGIAAIPGLDVGAVRSADKAARAHLRERLIEAGEDPNVNAARTAFGLIEAGPGAPVGRFGVRTVAEELRGAIAGALLPGDRVARRLAGRITVRSDLERAASPSLRPVMRYPKFPVPAALTLLATEPEWFMRGLADFPHNRSVLLGTNDGFIESYLAGLNHEMMRELNWREYPTDLRGTPFLRFWPRPDGGDDIPPMAEWRPGVALGKHLDFADRQISALLVRADVVRRFPDLIVAAAPAVTARRFNGDPATWKAPLFAISIDPSTAAYAFPLSAAELKGSPGWFFIFQEHRHSIRFGFDEPNAGVFATWSDARWPGDGPERAGDVPVSRGFAMAGGRLEAPEPGGDLAQRTARWDRDSADVARIALQRPFRMGIHARLLIG
jgi:hypothetical protein